MKIDSPTFLTETTFISASVQFSSGSQKFGNTTDDVHQFTGSVSFGGPVTASSNISGSAASTGTFGKLFLGNIGNNKTLSIGDSSIGNHKIYDNSGYLRLDSSIWLGNGYIYVGGTFNLDAGANDIRLGSSSGGANTIKFKTDGSTDGIVITQNDITSSGHFSGSSTSTGSFGVVHVDGITDSSGVFGGSLLIPDALTFGTDTDSSIKRKGANEIEFRMGGQDVFRIKATVGVSVENGNLEVESGNVIALSLIHI